MEGIQNIAAKGRYGDNHLLHVSDAELQGLNALAHEKFGRGLTTNPDTGLPEAFLFAPLLAPMLAPALAGTIGSTALATGLTAGALGTAEAAARGMDDPLQQGLMAGLTAGAGSALGEGLSAAADPATQAASGLGDAAKALGPQELAILEQSGNIVTPAATTAPGAMSSPMLNMPTSTPPGLPPGGTGMYSPAPTYNAPGSIGPQSSSPLGLTPGPTSPVDVNAQMLAQENMLQAGDDVLQGYRVPPEPSAFGQYAQAPKMWEGAKNVMSSTENFGNFIGQQKTPLALGAVGVGGQMALTEQQKMREDSERSQEARDAKKAATLKEHQDLIRANYARAGRALPTNPYTGAPIFQAGGIVGLMGGGRPFDSAPVQKYASGGVAYPAAGSGYTTNIYGQRIPYDNTISSNKSVGGKGGMMAGLLQGMFNGLNSQIKANLPEQVDPAGQRHTVLVDKLQTGMGNQQALKELEKEGYYNGGYLQTGGRVGDGMSDDIPATIDGTQPAALSDGEFVVPADVVSHLGNGSSDAGAQQLYSMMDRIRQARTGTTEQGKEINPKKMMPA
jgi:hypothetical protein